VARFSGEIHQGADWYLDARGHTGHNGFRLHSR
jgi:hypothetical protein